MKVANNLAEAFMTNTSIAPCCASASLNQVLRACGSDRSAHKRGFAPASLILSATEVSLSSLPWISTSAPKFKPLAIAAPIPLGLAAPVYKRSCLNQTIAGRWVAHTQAFIDSPFCTCALANRHGCAGNEACSQQCARPRVPLRLHLP